MVHRSAPKSGHGRQGATLSSLLDAVICSDKAWKHLVPSVASMHTMLAALVPQGQRDFSNDDRGSELRGTST